MPRSHRIVTALIGAWLMFSALAPSAVWANGFRTPRGNGTRNSAATRPVDTKARDAAAQEVTQAQSTLEKAQADFARLGSKLQRDADESPELAAALADQMQAQKAFDLAESNVERQLSLDPTYSAAQKQKETLQAQVDALRAGGTATLQEMTDAAKAVLAAGQVLTRLQVSAQADDPQFQQAKAALVKATAKVETLRQQYQQSLLSDPQWTAAKKAIADAQTQLRSVQAKLAQAQQAVTTALAKQQGSLAKQQGSTAGK